MAEKYITGNHRKTVGLGVKSAKIQSGAPRQVQIVCKSKDKGEKVMGAISACQPQWSYYIADSFWDNALGWGLVPGGQSVLGNWETFRVRCDSKDEASDLVADIGKCIDQYANYQEPDEPSSSSDPGAYTGNGYTGNGGASDTTKSTNWTTYLIIGAAAVAVIMLLWDRKKK
ncbi:MAG: hypothetical protein K6A94_12050 [Bacteroidales bacterium]|nr:hypothetical protein [Bacteroidales bacterium]